MKARITPTLLVRHRSLSHVTSSAAVDVASPQKKVATKPAVVTDDHSAKKNGAPSNIVAGSETRAEMKPKSEARGRVATSPAQRSLFDAISETPTAVAPVTTASIKGAARSRKVSEPKRGNPEIAISALPGVADSHAAANKSVAVRPPRSSVGRTSARTEARPLQSVKTRVAPIEGAHNSKVIPTTASTETAPKPALRASRGSKSTPTLVTSPVPATPSNLPPKIVAKIAHGEASHNARPKRGAMKPVAQSEAASENKAGSETITTATAATKAPRAKRKRVPRDLAQQYGESESRRGAAAVAEKPTTRRARRDAEMRERRNRVMLPDENFLQRLARSGTISSAPSALDESNAATMTAIENGVDDEASSLAKKTRGWSADCGKCRWNGTLKSAAALCPRCGAILVRP